MVFVAVFTLPKIAPQSLARSPGLLHFLLAPLESIPFVLVQVLRGLVELLNALGSLRKVVHGQRLKLSGSNLTFLSFRLGGIFGLNFAFFSRPRLLDLTVDELLPCI